MKTRVIAATALCAAALGACGTDGAEQSSAPAVAAPAVDPTTPAGAVSVAVTDVMTTTDRRSCTRLFTPRFLRQTTGARGLKALRECRKDADKPGAKTVSVDRVKVGKGGATATADIRPSGGQLPFKTASIRMRKVGGRWKADRLTRGTLDRPAFERVLREGLSEGKDPLPADAVACVATDLRAVGDKTLARAFLKPDPSLFLVYAAACSAGSAAARAGAPAVIAECVRTRVRRLLTTGAYGRRIKADPFGSVLNSPMLQRALGRIVTACANGLA
jgi:hypothetical protein